MNNIKPRDMQVFEILSEISNLTSDELKTNTLQKKYYDHTPLHRILKMNYCDTIQPMVPDGTPPFNRNENADGPNHASLWEYIRLFPVIVRSAQSVKMKPLQIERTFIEMLEAVDAKEAEIVCLAKDKKLQTKYEISSDVVKKAFPVLNILSIEPQVEKTNEEKAAEYIELAKVKKAEAKKLFDEAKQYILKAEKLNNENA